MAIADEWLFFLESYPELFELSKSGFFISLIDFISSEAKPFSAISAYFPSIEKKDMLLALSAMLKLGAIEKIGAGGNIFYLATEKGRGLLAEYKKTRRFFEL